MALPYYYDFQFDDSVADTFRNQAFHFKEELSRQRADLQSSANELFVTFTGAYAELMQVLVEQQKVDNSRAVTALDKLTRLLKFAKIRASEERERIEKHNLWMSRQQIQMPGEIDALSTCPSYDPEPPNVPLRRPVVTVNLHSSTRIRNATKAGRDRTSADTVILREFIRAAEQRNDQLDDMISNLQHAYNLFEISCSWANTNLSNLFLGLNRFLQENKADIDLLAGITSSFEYVDSLEHSGFCSPATKTSFYVILDMLKGYRTISAREQKTIIGPDNKIPFSGKPESKLVYQLVSGNEDQNSELNQCDFNVLSDNKAFSYAFSKTSPSLKNTGKLLGPLPKALSYWDTASSAYTKGLLEHPEWSETERRREAVGYSAVVGSTALAGAAFGASFGASVGSVLPGAGTVIGAVVGVTVGVAASLFFGKFGECFGESLWDTLFG